MTNAIKSKKTALWGPIFMGISTCLIAVGNSHAQSAGDDAPFGQLGIRGSIDEARDGDGENQQAETDTPIELGRIINNTRAQRVQPVGPVGVDPGELSSSARTGQAVDPVQTGTAATIDDDPFAPTGIRIGNTEVQLSLEQSLGYSSNVSRNANGSSGGFSQTDLIANFTSDWSRHQLQTNLNGSYRLPFDGDSVDSMSFSADTAFRLDLVDGMTFTTRGFYNAREQEFTSTTLVPGAVDTPLTQSYGGSVELERSDRRLQFSLRGTVQRDTFDDADLGGGITQSQEDQNSNLYSIGLRAGYEVSPALTPFLEGIYSMRDYDLSVDRNGNRRDSDIFELRGGVEVDLGEKVQGEIALGYVNERFDDPTLDNLNGFTLNGTLNWSPERDTQVRLTLGTQTNNSITANESGSLIYNARLEYERQLTDRLSMDAFTALQIETNDDSNTTFEMGVGVQYWVNRFMALTGDIEYSTFSSDAVNSDFDELSARVGVRLQR